MKRVHIHHQNRDVLIGGCRLPRHAPVGPKFAAFLKGAEAFPSSPPSRDWSAPALTVLHDTEGNDAVGDCVEASESHYIAVATGNTDGLYSYSTSQTLAMYSAMTGFNPADPSTDQGTDPIACLNYLTQNPYADGTKLAGWALVDAGNQDEVKYALNSFGNVKVWLGLPDGIINSMPSGDGFTWDIDRGSPDMNNGHCIESGGYDDQGIIVYTWGMIGHVTWRALAAWCSSGAGGGLAVRVSTDWVTKSTGQTPSGLNLSAMIASFNQYFNSNVPVPPSPAPPPPPGPPPSGPPSFSQAQGAIAAAVAANGHQLFVADQVVSLTGAALQPLWPSP